jgi:ATP-dependent protease ClpP protease subunit
MSEEEYTHTIDKAVRYSTEDPIFQIHNYNVDLRANHIYLVGEDAARQDDGSEPGVEYSMATRFIKNLNICMRKSGAPILVHMKSCGGDYSEGMAIYDALKACPNSVTILSYTHARSMSSIIFCAADKRVMMPHSTFMIHQGTTGFEGTYKQFQTEAEQDKLAFEDMMEIYVSTLKKKGSMHKQSRQKIRAFLEEKMRLKEEVYFTAKQAVELGFADEVFGADGTYDWSRLTKV